MFYKPTQAITDILSSYLEFDLKQLQLGVWSGDLQLRDVNLRRDALFPLLNPKNKGNDSNNVENQDIQLHLVNGTVGNLRIQVPWVGLVKGHGLDVQMSDVKIVLGFQSPSWNYPDSVKNNGQSHEDNESKSSEREKKQRLIREAERCFYYNLPISNPDACENTTTSSTEKKKINDLPQEKGKKDVIEANGGILERLMKSIVSSLMWRVLSGLNVEIKKLTIIFVVEGVELGITLESLVISTKIDGNKRSANNPTSHGVSMNSSPPSAPQTSSPQSVPNNANNGKQAIESRTLEQSLAKFVELNQLGIFIRKLSNRHEQYEPSSNESGFALKTSTSQLTKIPSQLEYILQPVDSTISIRIFSPIKRNEPISVAESSFSNNNQPPTNSITDTKIGEDTIVGKEISMKNKTKSSSRISLNTANTYFDDDGDIFQDALSEPGDLLKYDDEDDDINNDTFLDANCELREEKKHRRSSTLPSLRGITSIAPSISNDIKSNATHSRESQFVLHWSMSQVNTVICPHHYQLLDLFLCSLTKVKNGRPNQTILSCILNTNKLPDSEVVDFDNESILVHLRSRNYPFYNVPRCKKTKDVLQSWWRYAFKNVIRELRERKQMIGLRTYKPINIFPPSACAKARKQKKQYIDYYTKFCTSEEADSKEILNQLQELEDSLFVEQILLYRSIVRTKQFGPNTRKDSILTSDIKNQDDQKIGSNSSTGQSKDLANNGTKTPNKAQKSSPLNRRSLTESKSGRPPLQKRSSSLSLVSKPLPVARRQSTMSTRLHSSEKSIISDTDTSYHSSPTVFSMSISVANFQIIVCTKFPTNLKEENTVKLDKNTIAKNSNGLMALDGIPNEVILKFSLNHIHGHVQGKSRWNRHASICIQTSSIIGLHGKSIMSFSNNNTDNFTTDVVSQYSSQKQRLCSSTLPHLNEESSNHVDFDIGTVFMDNDDNQFFALSINILSEMQEIDSNHFERSTSVLTDVAKMKVNGDIASLEKVLLNFKDLEKNNWPRQILPPMSTNDMKNLFERHTQNDFKKFNASANLSPSRLFHIRFHGLDFALPVTNIGNRFDSKFPPSKTFFTEEQNEAYTFKIHVAMFEYCSGNPFPVDRFVKCNSIEDINLDDEGSIIIHSEPLKSYSENSISHDSRDYYPSFSMRKSSLDHDDEISSNLGQNTLCCAEDYIEASDQSMKFLDLENLIHEYPGSETDHKVSNFSKLN